MKLSDYVIEFLASKGIEYNFLVSGGAVIHLVDSTAKHPIMKYICAQHEQNGAAAADMYARATGIPGLMMTTSGPGATNILTSVCSAYFDSIPMICITGQVARFRIRKSTKLRQRGFQETDVVSIFKSITKYAKLIMDPLSIRYELEKAFHLATEGRPGPVLLDIPDDLQRIDINPESLKSYKPEKKKQKSISSDISKLFELINAAKRPVLIYGSGVHAARSEKAAVEFAEKYNLPVVLTWGGADLFPHDHILNFGGIGVCGPRAGNFAIQNSDLVIAMGTRLSQMITGGKQSLFAPNAKKIMVDIDGEELEKFDSETFILDLPIKSDLASFFSSIKSFDSQADRFQDWRETIRNWSLRYPICPQTYFNQSSRVNPYVFIKELSKQCKEGTTIISDTGANVSWTMQAFETKVGQRLHSAWNNTPMGFSVPASVGAALGLKKEVICIIGDGGLMMCLQELGTIARHNLPVKIFLFNNKGHGIQKQTMDTWLNSNYAAVDHETGLYFPDYQKIAEAFRISYLKISNDIEIQGILEQVMLASGPVFCDVEVIENQKIVPMLKFGGGLQDLDPKISLEEMNRVLEESNFNHISNAVVATSCRENIASDSPRDLISKSHLTSQQELLSPEKSLKDISCQLPNS